MSDISEMVLDGILCSSCGVYVDGEEVGFPRMCSECKRECEGVDNEDEE